MKQKKKFADTVKRARSFVLGSLVPKRMEEGIFLAGFCLGTNHKSDRSTKQFLACYIPVGGRNQVRIE